MSIHNVFSCSRIRFFLFKALQAALFTEVWHTLRWRSTTVDFQLVQGTDGRCVRSSGKRHLSSINSNIVEPGAPLPCVVTLFAIRRASCAVHFWSVLPTIACFASCLLIIGFCSTPPCREVREHVEAIRSQLQRVQQLPHQQSQQ